MEKKFKPSQVEKDIYEKWEKAGHFTPKLDAKKKPFSIVMPPPNANAALHIGHVLFIGLEDIMTRYHRMKGEETLWLPGIDHAGIATQVAFEKELEKKGKTRFDLGRETFFKACMEFSLKNKKKIEDRFRMVGASCDWSRNSFTLDPKFSKPIYTTFKKLYDDGLIYRGERLINWCVRCKTALSDLEVDYKEKRAKLYYLRYPLIGDLDWHDKYVVVATTRPETMLGDAAVAVNPNDKRYKKLIGQEVRLPLVGRHLKIIADKRVDPGFGTGAIKVTPAHDPVDFDLAKDHGLDFNNVISEDGKIENVVDVDGTESEFNGMPTSEARKKIIETLQTSGLVKEIRDYTHRVGHCERCKSVIEPLVSLQWFVKMDSLAKSAIEAVKSGKIKILPKHFEKTYFHWMGIIHDWCISRQLWWGHQLPVYYCECGETIVSVEKPKKCPKCSRTNFKQDEDVLDTWFSSGQWPFSTLGFYEKSKDYKYFYPTSVMETGYEILFIWVAKMIMLSLYVTGEVPFEVIYLHGMVRDAFGKKMSKSRPETAVDPVETIEQYGADALRMALVVGSSPGNDVSVTTEKIVGYRNFANKVWNIGRFINLNFKEAKDVPFYSKKMDKDLEKADKEILKDLDALVEQTTKNLDNFRFSQAGEDVYAFVWHEFADKYIEAVKDRLRGDDRKSKEAALSVLRHVLLTTLKLLHPFMPFVTEAVWQEIPRKHDDPLIVSSWPKV